MVDIDPTQKKYAVRFRPKDQHQNKTDDKIEIFRAILGIADTNNILEVTKESERVKYSKQKKSVFLKDKQTISEQLYSIKILLVSCTKLHGTLISAKQSPR